MIPAYELLIVVLFTFSSTIVYILLLSERRVWGLLGRRAAVGPEGEVGFVHRVLNLFIQIYIVTGGRVVAAVRAVKGKDSDGPIDTVSRGVVDLVPAACRETPGA